MSLYARLQQGRDLSRRKARRVLAAMEIEVRAVLQQRRRRAGRLRSGAEVACCACSCTVASAGRRRTRRRRAGRRQRARTNRIEGEKQIYLHPSGWVAAQWWDEEQVDNILRSVDTLKRKYNIDESKIYITGISDGGTGVYYMALKEPNPWSAYLPLNGASQCCAIPENGADGEMHGNNLINSPLYVVNGENDPLYPVAPGRAAHRMAEEDGRERDVPAASRRGTQHRMVADRARAVRAVRPRPSARRAIRLRCRGKPSASIASIAIAG